MIHNPYKRFIKRTSYGAGMTRRRSKLEIHLEILNSIKMGVKKPTRIMYAVNVSWKPLQHAFENMLSQDLISEVDTTYSEDSRTSRVYEITSKGDSVLKYFRKAQNMLGIKNVISIKP